MAMSQVAVPQLTFRAVVLSIILAVILAAANAYLGLFAGLTIATAIPAAVVSMGVLRLLGGGTILDNNIVQTRASAGSANDTMEVPSVAAQSPAIRIVFTLDVFT